MSNGVELIDLVARWIHVIAAVMWIGNSLLFNWLDRSLEAPGPATQTPRPSGTIWLLHSGGFYYVEKTLLAGAPLPARVHWFRWQAYTTWWSGVVLLLAVYYLGGRAVLTDATLAQLTHVEGVLVGVGAVFGGWLLYEVMQRMVAPRFPRVAMATWLAGLTAIAIALTQLLNGRAAFVHAGAMLATIMAANVVLTIVPSQRALVASVERGAGGDPAVSARAKRVSIHNNYFTFPVIVLMLSGHFPAVYGHRLAWVNLLLLVAGGAAVRHVLNLRFTWPHWRTALAATMVATVAALFVVMGIGARQDVGASLVVSGPVSFAEVRHIIDQRCLVCHSAQPSNTAFGVAPGGVMFDLPDQVVARAARIGERAVVTRTMPPANKTAITEMERAMLKRWIADGATGP